MEKSCVKVFIGHSTKDFKDSIDGLKSFLEELSLSFGAEVKVFVCEDKTVSGQDEINEKWIKPSDIAFFCFKERVGEFTKEELEVAVNEYQNNKFTPQIFVYIQDGKKDASLEEIMKKLEQKYRVFYFDFDDYAIKLRFAQNISQTLGGSGKVTAEGRKILIDDKPINLQIKHLSAIKNNEDYKELQEEINSLRTKRNEAEEEGDSDLYYSLSEEINQKINAQIQMEKDALSIYEYLNNQLKKENADEDAIKALALATQGKINEALALLPADQLIKQSQNTVEGFNLGKKLVENAKEQSEKLIEKLNARIEILQLKINEVGVIEEINELYKALVAQEDIIKEYLYTIEYVSFLVIHNMTTEAYNVTLNYIEKMKGIYDINEEDKLYYLGRGYNTLSLCCNILSLQQETEQSSKEAIKVYEELAKIDEIYLEDLSEGYNGLALLYTNLNSVELAEEYSLKAIEIREKLAKDNDDYALGDLATSYTGIATLFTKTLQSEKGEKYLFKAIEIYEKLVVNKKDVYLGMLSVAYIGLANLYNTWGRYDEANAYNLKALEKLEEGLEIDRAFYLGYTALCCTNLAATLNGMGSFSDAVQYNEKALAYYEELTEQDEQRYIWQLALAYENASTTCHGLGFMDKAVEYADNVLEIRKAVADIDSERFGFDLSKGYNKRGYLAYCMKDYETAIDYYVKAVEVCTPLLERDRLPHLSAMALYLKDLATAYKDIENYDKAEEVLLTTIEMYGELLTIDRDRYLNIFKTVNYELAYVYEKRLEKDKTEQNFLNLIDIQELLLTYDEVKNFNKLALSYNNIASFYFAEKRQKEAEEYFIKSVELSKKYFDINNEHSSSCHALAVINLSYVYYLNKNYEEAEKYLKEALNVREVLYNKNAAKHKTLLNTVYRVALMIYTATENKEKIEEFTLKMQGLK